MMANFHSHITTVVRNTNLTLQYGSSLVSLCMLYGKITRFFAFFETHNCWSNFKNSKDSKGKNNLLNKEKNYRGKNMYNKKIIFEQLVS